MPVATSEGPRLDLTADDPPDACAALLRAARDHADSSVVVASAAGTERRTYPELLLRARHLLAGLRARGRGVGDTVLLHGLPLTEFFPAFWACVLGGFRPAAIADPLSAGAPEAAVARFQHVCRLLDEPLVLTRPELVPVLAPLAGGAVVAGVDECVAASPAVDTCSPQPDDVAVLMLSSGSTGLPKAIQLTHRGLARFAASSRQALDVQPDHVTLNWMPVDHSGAFLLYHVLEVFVGCTNVHAPTDFVLADPLRWLDLMSSHSVRHAWAPNFAYALVADALPGRGGWDLSRLSTLVSGGEQVTLPVVSRFLEATREFGVRKESFMPVWGMAETATAVTYGRLTVHEVLKSSVDGELRPAGADVPERDRVTLISVGPPAPGVAVRVVDEHGEVLPERRIGRLHVRADGRLMSGYLGDEAATTAAFAEHGWLDSGDLAFLSGGEVVITGRAKDVIILNGHNYFCHEIESVAATVPSLAIGRVAACGVPDERTGSEELRVFVATDDPDPAGMANEVRAALFHRLGISGCRVVPVPELEFPRTPSGKVQRAKLRERPLGTVWVAAARPAQSAPDRVREIVESVLGQQVDVDTPFYELGLTSVPLARVRGLLEKELGREIPPTAPFRYPTVSALAEHLGSGAAAPVEPVTPPVTDGRVAIIGMALRFPGARTLEEFWANLRAGVDSVRRFAPAAPGYLAVGGVLDDVDAFDAGFFGISPREAELTDPAHRLFLECAYHALEDGGYADASGQRIGVYAGSGMNLYGYQDPVSPHETVDPATGMLASIGTRPDFLASRVAYRLGLTGPAVGVQTACSTSLVAVHLAAQAVLTGDADLALAGAAAVRLPQETGYQHHPGSVLSPTGRLRAFDAEADGTVGGNGVAAVLLKPLAAALADGDPVYAVLLGSAVNNDGTGKVGFTAPSVPGQVAVIRQALRRAAVPPETVSYVEAHATGTELGDPIEFDALREAYAADQTGFCTLGSVKPNIGHLDSCAGMAGLIKVALMLRHRELVPTVHLKRPNPALQLAGSPFTLGTERREWTVADQPRRAGVSALGVGGTNAHVILEEPPAPGAHPESPHRAVLVPVSAADRESLGELAGLLRDRLRTNPVPRAIDVAFSLALGRRHLAHRLAVVGRDSAELAEGLDAVAAAGEPVGPLVFAMCGQESVRPGMAAGLYAEFPAVREVLDECERAYPGLLAQLLGDPVRDTQPALFAFQAALVELWRSAGVEPAAVTGHSLGEYAALYAAGALSLVDGIRLTTARAEAMRSVSPGGMLAVGAPEDVVHRIASASGTEIAVVNGPRLYTLSGPPAAVTRAESMASAEYVANVRIDTDRAYHSSLIEPALAELDRHAGMIDWQPLRLPMISSVDGQTLPEGHRVDAAYVCRQTRQPVRFDNVVSTMESLGHRDVVELGPAEVLCTLGRRAYPGGRWLATLPRSDDPTSAFLSAVGELYRRGLTVNWSALAMDGQRIPLPGYPFRKQRFPAEQQDDPIVTEVCDLTARLLGAETIDPDRTFLEHGGDSLTLMNMTRELAEAFGVRVPIRQLFGEADTPRKLAELIAPHATRTPAPPATERSATASPPPAPAPSAAGPPAAGPPAAALAPPAAAPPAAAPAPSAAAPAAAPSATASPPPAPAPSAAGPAPHAGAPSAAAPAPPAAAAAPPAAAPARSAAAPLAAVPAVAVPAVAPPPAATSATAAEPLAAIAPPPAAERPAAAAPSAEPPLVAPPPLPVAQEPPAVAAGGREMQPVIDRQLALAELLVNRVTNLMSEQLAALGNQPATLATPTTPQADQPPPASSAALAAAHQSPTATPPPAATPTQPPAASQVSPPPAISTLPPAATAAPPTGTAAALAPVVTPVPPPAATASPAATPAPPLAAVPSAPSVAQPAAAAPTPLPPTTPAPLTRREACEFSLYFFGDYPDENRTEKYSLITAAAQFADQHGFHALWLPERHFHSFGALFPNPSVLAAALAAQTTQIRLNAGSVVLPLHNPIRVAEEWSVVDNLSGGRVGLCVASGWHATDFVLAPDNFGRHRELMYTHLDTVRRLWAGDPMTATSGSGDEVEIRVHPRPLQEQPPMFVAVVGNPDSYRRAAEQDLGIVTNLMAQSVDQLTANIALYRQTRADRGLDPAAGRIVVLVHTYLGADLEKVRQEAYEPFCAYLRSSLSLFDQVTNSLGVDIDLKTTPEDDVAFLLGQAYRRYCESRALIGTTDSSAPVVDALLAAGADEIACFVDFGVPADQVLAALPTLDELRKRFLPGQPQRLPLSAAQRRIWFLDRLYPGQLIYHEPKAIRLTGPLDVPALREALRQVVDRQPALRTIFLDDGGEPYRMILPGADVDCLLVDRTGGTENDALREALHTTGREVFDLTTGPLIAARLVRLAADRHLLFLSAHHIVFDSSSTAAFLRDLAAFYRGEPNDLPAIPAEPQQSEPSDEDIEFWRAHLAGAPALRLPTDHPRPATRTGAGAGLTHEVDGELTDQLQDLATDAGVTMFMAVLGAIAAVLGRFSGQDDLVIGTAMSNRPRGADGVVGLFLDTLPLRVDLSGEPGFAELASRILYTTTEAYEHRGAPFDELVSILNPDRDPGSNPLFSVMVEFENETTVQFDPSTLDVTVLDVVAERAPFDLSFYLTWHAGGLRVMVEYDTDIFAGATVRRLLTHFEEVLRRAVGDSAASLSELTAATGNDRAEIARWQGGEAPEPTCLHELVERQADRTPGATALVAGDTELTYQELDERANRVANWLLANNIGRGDLVAVRMVRGAGLITTLLGVLKSGAAYLPVDPALPQDRVDLMLADSSAALLLEVEPDGTDATRPSISVGPEEPAYCIYTSGSSGRPKGVLVPHRGPANVVRWQLTQHSPLRTLQWTSPAFDVSVQEIFSTLAAGASLVLIGDETRYDPAAVAELARAYRVQRVFMPFTPMKYLLEIGPSLPDLRVVIQCGEPMMLTPALRRFFAAHPDCVLYNQYGPTEASIIVTSQQVDVTNEGAPPIGTPIAGVTVEVLDGHGELVPVGAVGELYLGGLGVATGYLGRPEETAAAFAGGRYRTGDLGRWRADGTLEFFGRRDNQVKIRGYRVEPGEAERVLAELPGVRDAAVVVRANHADEPELVGYVVLDAGADQDALEPRLRATLPSYLVPQHLVALDQLPVTANGKLDRRRLPAPTVSGTGAEPATPLEQALHDLWCHELGHPAVAVDRSFFALGGHSLSAVRLLHRVAEQFGIECTLSEFFRDPTIRALAAGAQPDTVDTAPLTSLQQRLWRRHTARVDPAVYNVAHRIDLRGELDPAALQHAIEAFVHRHHALRMRVAIVDGELVQEIGAPSPVPLPVHDIEDVDQWSQEICAPKFALDEAPLYRFQLGRVAPSHWVLVMVCHHMICDGFSLGIMWRELAELYAAARDGREPELPEPMQHTDYARSAPDTVRQAKLARFWQTELSGVDLFPRLPTDRPRPEKLSGAGALHESTLPAHLSSAIRAAAADAGGTPYAVLAVAFARWLSGLCDTRDVVLAASSANRTRPELESVVGMIGDAVLVRVRPGDGDLGELVRQFSASLFAAMDHQDLPLTEVVRLVAPELVDRHFPTVLFTVVTTPPPELALDGVDTLVREVDVPGLARTELYVRVVVAGADIRVCWEYSTDLFTPDTIAGWDAGLRAVLERLTGAAGQLAA